MPLFSFVFLLLFLGSLRNCGWSQSYFILIPVFPAVLFASEFFLIKPESPYVCIVFSLQVVCFWGHPFQQISEFAWLLLAVLWCFQTSFLEKLSFCSRSYLLLPYCYVLYRYWGKLILNFLIPADSWGDSFMLVSSSFSPYPFLCFMFACGSLKSTVSFSDANVHYFSLPLR